MTLFSRALEPRALLLLVAIPFVACGEPDRASGDAAPEGSRFENTKTARGRYLVEGLLQCMICHSERDWGTTGAPPVEGRKGAGRIIQEDGSYRLVAPNLTPDPETGIARWSDEQLIRAIRRGIGHDGRALHPLMPYDAFRHLNDAAVRAVVAYLRSLEPVHNPLPSTNLSPAQQDSAQARSPVQPDPVYLSNADPIERGRALVVLGRCSGCHTAWSGPRRAPLLAGGDLIVRGKRSAFSANITPDSTGMPYDAKTFIAVIRTGRGGTLSPLMPWVAFRNLNDADLRAIHAFLRTRRPFSHWVSNYGEPTFCEVCGQVHGLGELNDGTPPPGIRLDPASYDRYTGIYIRLPNADDTLTVEATPDGLAVRLGDGPALDVVVLSPHQILVPGLLRAPLRFEFDGRKAVRAIYEAVEPVVFSTSVAEAHEND